jgi:hypothetical protein
MQQMLPAHCSYQPTQVAHYIHAHTSTTGQGPINEVVYQTQPLVSLLLVVERIAPGIHL